MDSRKKFREVSRKALLMHRLDKLMEQRRGREEEKRKKAVGIDRENVAFLHKAIATANKRAATHTRKAGRRTRRKRKS